MIRFNFINDFKELDNEISKRILKEYNADKDYDKVITYINSTYLNDLQD